MKSQKLMDKPFPSLGNVVYLAVAETASSQKVDAKTGLDLQAPLPTLNYFFDQPAKPVVVDTKAAIEGMPHLLGKIQGLWKSRDLNTFISELLLDSRDGERSGFHFSVAEELMFLAKVNLLLRAEDTSKLLDVTVSEAIALIIKGDQMALGHNTDDMWLHNLAGSKKNTTMPVGNAGQINILGRPPTSVGQLVSRHLSSKLTRFLIDTPPLPLSVRLDITTPRLRRSVLGDSDDSCIMDKDFFRCIAKELSNLQIEQLVLSSLGESTHCDWLASAIRFTDIHCRFKTVVLHVDLLSTPEVQLKQFIKEGLGHLVIYLNQASGKWRAQAQEIAGSDPDYFRSELQRLIQFRDEHQARTGTFCKLSVATNTHRAAHAFCDLFAHLRDQPGLLPYAEILLPQGVSNQEAKERGNCHCLAPFIEAHVRTNGHLVICAMDHTGHSFTADLKQTNFTDAWLSQAFRKARQRTVQGEKVGQLCEICPHQSAELKR